jgi:histidinol-phosphatase (PHP family)
MYDYHTHSCYSDGEFFFLMLPAAVEAGLEGIGFADHAMISDREFVHQERDRKGFLLAETYEHRRNAIESLRDEYDIEIYDAVEVDYDPRDEGAIRGFLDEAAFDYAVGSVHYVNDQHVKHPTAFDDWSRDQREAFVADYFEQVESLVESELFDILAHLDLIERNEVFAGLPTEEQYRSLAATLESNATIPEVNGLSMHGERNGVTSDGGLRHIADEYDFEFTVGSDAHGPNDIQKGLDAITHAFAEHDLTRATLPVSESS